MKASNLVLTIGIIFFAVLNFTNTTTGPKPITNKLSKGMTFHPFTQLKIKNPDSSKLQHQTTYKIPKNMTVEKKSFIRSPGKQLTSRVK